MKSMIKWSFVMVLIVGLLCVSPVLASEQRKDPDTSFEIAAIRATVENDLAQQCASEWGEEVETVVTALAGLSDAELLAADEADNCETVRSVLSGVMETIGDLDQDYVYTPVTPCVIVDTRSTAAGPIATNTQRNFYVFGNLASQGGSNCPKPAGKGEPRGVHINLIAIPVSGGNGNIRAFPYNAPTSDGLSVNFNSGIPVNLANAGTIPSCYLCGPEITVKANYATANVKIEILGYYYEGEVDEIDLDALYYQASADYGPIAAGSTGSYTATCASGYRVMGGGWFSRRNQPPHYQDRSVNAYSNRPNGTNGWRADIYNNSSQWHWITVYAICFKTY